MRLTANLALSAAFVLLVAPARAQFQVAHDVPNTNTIPQLTPVVLADGNTVTHQWNAGEHLFRKYDESGTLLWSRVLAGNALPLFYGNKAVTLLSDEVGGVIFASHDSIRNFQGQGPFPQDSLVHSYRILRISGSGELTSAILVKNFFAHSWPIFGSNLKGFDAVRAPDDGVVVCVTMDAAGPEYIDLFKINADGTMAWSRSVGQSFGLTQGPKPARAFNTSSNATMAISSTGTMYYSEGGNAPSNHLRLAALDSDGSMLWMKRYVYGNTSPLIQYHDIAVDAAGDVQAAGSLTTTVGRFHIFLRTSATGLLERGDIYRTPYGLSKGHFGLDGQGRRYHRVDVLDLGTNATSHGILIADTLGTPARFVRRNDEVVLPNNVFTIPQRIDVAGDRLAVSNLLHHEDVDFAYTTRYEALSMFTTDDIEPCLMGDTALAHLAVPLDPVMTTEDVSTAVSLDVSAYYSAEPIALTLTDPDAEELAPLCDFVVQLLEINTGVSSAAVAEALPLIQNTLVAQGTPLTLNSTAVFAVEVYDRNGALVQRSLLNDRRSLSTSTWSPGMYLIRAMDREGSTTGIGRVVLE